MPYKIPKDSPTELGQYVQLRNREPKGYLVDMWQAHQNHPFIWVTVYWDVEYVGSPKVVSIVELQKIKGEYDEDHS